MSGRSLYQIRQSFASCLHYNDDMNSSPIILLHGWSMNPAAFDELCRCLPPDLELQRPSLPGYPGSAWQCRDDFDEEIETMGRALPPGRLVGWSLGGLYAIKLAHRFPGRFGALALIASNPCFVRRQDWTCALGAADFDAFHADLERDWRRALRRFLALLTLGGPGQRDAIRRLGEAIEFAGAPAADVLRLGLDRLRELDCRAALAGLDQPCQLLLGDQDRLVPTALAREIADLVPEIRVESLAGAAHAPFLSHPERVADWLSALPE